MNDLLGITSDRTHPRSSSPYSKVSDEHMRLGAALYIRQSTNSQLREHQESTARQYALQDRLVSLGWASDQIVVIDDDLGISGSGSGNRIGFRRLLKLITDQKVGIVMGLEMSRLARNSKDWGDLFEVCAIFQTLIADEDGVFDWKVINRCSLACLSLHLLESRHRGSRAFLSKRAVDIRGAKSQ